MAPHFPIPRREPAELPAPPVARRLLPVAAGPKMRVLSVLSSSNQMYSGIGRAFFELTARLRERVDFEIAIDDLYPKNLDLVVDFGRRHEIPVHIGPSLTSPRSLDSFSATLPIQLRRTVWDAVETLCWANSATNGVVLREIGNRALVYTPHYQPLWTVPMSDEVSHNTDDVHHRTARRADAVLCDSTWERQVVQAQTHGRNNCLNVPLGSNPGEYRPGPLERKPHLLFVGDLAEPRKRFDRILAILPRILERWPDMKLVVIGNGSDRALERIPHELRHACLLKGYVSESELRQSYAESRAVFLLSEFEAFGIPILEGLASGTPVFLTDLAVTRSVFESFAGARFCPGDDADATFAIVERTLAQGEDAIRETLADRDRIAATFDWDGLALRKWKALSSAWFARHYLDHPFRGPIAYDVLCGSKVLAG
ncbi:glycosyltransferase family 4 protein [Tundrisphaera lichenicola]|uniref:glycosyltransferase family 4 protein n=1 Tax=Tundrisphaera lichenicola TaxID=2029860 RepID=UPI003EBF4402